MSGLTALLFVLLAAPAEAPAELIRNEPWNFRVLGKLPPGWKRRNGSTLDFTYTLETIPHAHTRLFYSHIKGTIDPQVVLEKRRGAYRFPGAKGAKEIMGEASWGGFPAAVFRHEVKLHGVVCRRRVTAIAVRNVWYELIETVYGNIDADPDYAAGRDMFRTGFRILTHPLPKERKGDREPRKIENTELQFAIEKPKGFVEREFNVGEDPGCRVAFERRDDGGRGYALVRLFEYGPRRSVNFDRWLNTFFGAFAGRHEGSVRVDVAAPKIEGAAQQTAQEFQGKSARGTDTRSLALMMLTHDKRLFCLRVTTTDQAAKLYRTELDAAISSLRLGR